MLEVIYGEYTISRLDFKICKIPFDTAKRCMNLIDVYGIVNDKKIVHIDNRTKLQDFEDFAIKDNDKLKVKIIDRCVLSMLQDTAKNIKQGISDIRIGTSAMALMVISWIIGKDYADVADVVFNIADEIL